MCLHINYNTHIACDLSFIVKSEGVLKVTYGQVHFKSGIISEMVDIEIDIIRTGQKREVIFGLFPSSNFDDLGCSSR